MTRRGWGVGAMVVASTLVMAGCTGDPEPSPVSATPTPTETAAAEPTPTATPSPSATALTDEEIIEALPPAARNEDFIGAQAFVEFYVGLFPELFQENAQPELFAVLSGPDCVFCANALENAESAVSQGLSTRGGRISFPDLVARGGLGENDTWLVETAYEEATTEFLDEAGEVVDVAELDTGKVVAVVDFNQGLWTVLDVAFESDHVD